MTARRRQSELHHQAVLEQLEHERKDWMIPTAAAPQPVDLTSLGRDPYMKALAAARGDPTKVPDNWAD